MTQHHWGNLEHWRQRSDIKQKEKYIDVEDTANPRGLLLMDRDAVLSFMKRGFYLDPTHARSVNLSEKVFFFSYWAEPGQKESRGSHHPGLCPLCCLRESSMRGPVQPASKPVSYRQTFNGTYPESRWAITSPDLWPPLRPFSNPLNRSWVSPLFSDAW